MTKDRLYIVLLLCLAGYIGDVLLFLNKVFDSGTGKWGRFITKTFMIYVGMIM